MLREDTTARIERIAVPVPRPTWGERLSDWMNEAPARPDSEIMYEFSVGTYTFGQEISKSWEFARIPAAAFARAAETQQVTPVLLMRNAKGRRWWWYLDRFYRESEELTADEVHTRVLHLHRAEADRARRREGVVAGVS